MAQAPAGMRSVRKGHRIIRSNWLEKTNKGSGVPDIGILTIVIVGHETTNHEPTMIPHTRSRSHSAESDSARDAPSPTS